MGQDGQAIVTREELEEVERLDSEATPGPWSIHPIGIHRWLVTPEYSSATSISVEDAAFIAAARTLLPRLARAYRGLLGAHAQATDEAYKAGRREAIEEAEKAVMSLPDGTWGDETGERCPWPIAAKAIRAITKGPARGE